MTHDERTEIIQRMTKIAGRSGHETLLLCVIAECLNELLLLKLQPSVELVSDEDLPLDRLDDGKTVRPFIR